MENKERRRVAVQTRGEVLSNEEIAPGVFTIQMDASEIAKAAVPGQFVHIRIGQGFDPLLRRPFAICRTDSRTGRIEILYEVVGRGTKELSRKQKGDILDLLGPLGRGYWIPEDCDRGILVAGGRGIASLVFLAEKLVVQEREVILLMGARSEDRLFFEEYLLGLGVDVRIATDDGSKGHRGPVTELLASCLEGTRPSVVFACGPEPMMAKVARIAMERNLPCQLSLEARMGCGLGACQSCVIEATGDHRYKRVCVDGPVFDAREVLF